MSQTSGMDRLRANKIYLMERYKSGVGTHTLGQEMDCNSSLVRKFLEKECMITIRKAIKIDDMKDEFIKLYNDGKKIGEIAEELGIDKTSASRYRKKIGLPAKRKNNLENIENYRDKILSMYEAGHGCVVISREINMGENRILDFLRKEGIEIRGVREDVSNKIKPHKAYIIREYKNGASTVKLGQEIGCSNASIYLFLRKECVPIRGVNYAKNKKDEIIQLFNDGVQPEDISRDLLICSESIRNILRNEGYEVRSIRVDFEKDYGEEIEEYYHRGYGCTQLSKKFDTCDSHILEILNRRNIETGKYQLHYSFNKNYLDNIDKPEKAYYIGYFIGDGCNRTTTATITSIDKHILEDMTKLFESDIPLGVIEPKNDRCKYQYRFSLYSTHLCKQLLKYSCHPNKTFSTFLPTIRHDLYRHLFRGLLDAEGSICRSTSGWYASLCGNTVFMDQCQKFVEKELEICSHLYPCGNIILLRIYRKNDILKFLNWIYQDSTIHMNRKYDKYIQFCTEYGFEPVKTLNPNP